MLDILVAGLAGIVTIAAPCTLPVLPILLGASIGHAGRGRPALIIAGFVLSFTAVALLLGAVTRQFDFDPNILRSAATGLLALFGLLMIWPAPYEQFAIRLGALLPRRHAASSTSRQGLLGGFLLGASLGLVWTPCAGPVLGSILTVIATSADSRGSALLLLAYAMGAAIPMFAIAYGGQAVTTRVRRIAQIAPRLQQAFGVLIVGVAAATYLQYDAVIVAWLSHFYPNGQIGL